MGHLILLGAPAQPSRDAGAFRVPAHLAAVHRRGAFSREVSRDQYGANSALTLGNGTVDAWPPELVSVGCFASQREAFKSTLPYYYPAITGFLGRPRVDRLARRLATLPMPVLGPLGRHDVFLTRPRCTLGRAIPNFEEVLLHAGHAPWLNKPASSGLPPSARSLTRPDHAIPEMSTTRGIGLPLECSTGWGVGIPPMGGPVCPLTAVPDPELTPSTPAESEPDDRHATSENHHDDSDETPPQ